MNKGSIPSLRVAELISKRNVLKLTLIALSYFLAHQIAFLFPDTARIVMAVWPAGGIGLASLLLSPRRLWPLILAVLFVSGMSADLLANRGLFLSAGFMTANILESLGCAWIIGGWREEKIRFDKTKDIVALILAAIGVNACTSFIGAGTALLNSSGMSFWGFWRTWWVADGLGILIFAPFFVTWAISLKFLLKNIRLLALLEVAVFLLFWCILALMAFTRGSVFSRWGFGPYMLIPPVVWIGLRFDQRTVTTGLVILACIIFFGHSVKIDSPLWVNDSLADLLLDQIFLGVIASTGMLFSASFCERKRLQKELSSLNTQLEGLVAERTAELVHVSRVAVMGQITAAFAHELNQPLGAILNSAATLEMNLSREIPDCEEARKDLSDIVEADQRAAAVIRKIRSLTKKDGPRAVLPLDMNRLVRQTVALLRKDPFFQSLEFLWDLQDGLPLVSGDPVQLQQVFLNLIVNAAEAVSGSALRQLTVRSSGSGPSVMMSFTDTGPGIDDSKIEEYARPFYTTKKEGLGMGLFVSRLIVQGHGGELRIGNVPGAGARFVVSLPGRKETG
jgi:signal transduction histidine kinase